MMMYLRYFWYVVKHKWFVFLECCRLGIPFRGIVHDLSKFRWSEFRDYAFNFYASEKAKSDHSFNLYGEYHVWEAIPWGMMYHDKFEIAWLHHQRRNLHHWQYWVNWKRKGYEFPVPIPKRYLKEMLADWRAMSRTKHNDPAEWYLKNQNKMLIRDGSREWLEKQLGIRDEAVALREKEAIAALGAKYVNYRPEVIREEIEDESQHRTG